MKKGLSMPDLTQAERGADGIEENVRQKPEAGRGSRDDFPKTALPVSSPPHPSRPSSFARQPAASFSNRPTSPVSAEGGRTPWSMPQQTVRLCPEGHFPLANAVPN